jgi:hypothetical protein
MESEDKPLAAGTFPIGLWSTLLLASVALLAWSGNIEEYEVFALVGGAILTAALAFRLRVFRRKAPSLLATGEVLEPFNYRAQVRRIYYLITAVAASFFAPFALSGVLDTPSWIGSLVGAVDGWVASMVVYNAFLRSWQARHGGKLYQSHVWRGTKVTHTGLKFLRDQPH